MTPEEQAALAEAGKRRKEEEEYRERKMRDLEREASLFQRIGDARSAEFAMNEKILLQMDLMIKNGAAAINNSADAQQYYEENKEALMAMNISAQEFNEHLINGGDLIELMKKRKKDFNEALDETKKLASEADSFFGGIASKIGIGNSGLAKSVVGIKKFVERAEDGEAVFEEYAKSFKRTFSSLNVAGSILESIFAATFQFVKEMDTALAGFNAITGAGGKFDKTIASIVKNNRDMGMTFDKTTDALGSLTINLASFNDLSEGAINNLTLTTGALARLGVDTDTSTNLFNSMTKSMGVSETQAAEMTKEMALMGGAIGSSSKFIKGFNQAQSTLAVHGKKSIEIFSDLAAAARAAGVEVNTLLAVAGQFDTFESAATAAGKLNAVLGSQLSATEMLMMTEEDRIETLIRSVQASGTAFNQLDRFTQKAIAHSVGITDMAEANKIFGMSLGAYKRHRREMELSAQKEEAFNKAIEATIPLQEKFQSILIELVPFVDDLVDALEFTKNMLVDFVIPAFKAQNGLLLKAAMGFSVLRMAVYLFGPVFSGITMIFKGFAGANTAVNKSMMKTPGTILRVSSAALAGAKGIAVLTLAALGIGAAILMAGEGIASVIGSFAFLSGGQMFAAIGTVTALAVAFKLLAAGSIAVAAAGSPAALALAAIAGPVFLIGTAIGAAAAGIGVLVSAFTGNAIFAEATTSVTAQADAIINAANALSGLGERRKLELISTLESMATIITGRASGIASQRAGNAIQEISNNIENTVQNQLEVVVSIDGKALETTILDTVQGSSSPGGKA